MSHDLGIKRLYEYQAGTKQGNTKLIVTRSLDYPSTYLFKYCIKYLVNKQKLLIRPEKEVQEAHQHISVGSSNYIYLYNWDAIGVKEWDEFVSFVKSSYTYLTFSWATKQYYCSKSRSSDSAYPHGKKAWVYVCMFTKPFSKTSEWFYQWYVFQHFKHT